MTARCCRLAGRRSCRASSPVFEPPARPLLAPLFAGRIEAARAPTTSADGRLHEHDHGPPEHLDPRNPRSGRLPGLDRKSPSVRGSRRSLSGSGAGLTDARHSRRDCSRRRLRPNPDRPGHLSSQDATPRRSGATRRRTGAASDERSSKERPPSGRHGAGHPRRGPASTDPRCLPSRGRSRANWHVPVSQGRQTWSRRLFHHRRGTQEDACVRSRWPDGPTARKANHPPSTRRSAPE